MVLLTYIVPTEVFFNRHAVKGRGLIPPLNTNGLGSNDPTVRVIRAGIVDAQSEVDFHPDFSTFRYMPWAPGHAIVMGNTFKRQHPPVPWDFDSKVVLRQLTDKLRDQYGLKMICGTESEFYLYEKLDEKGHPIRMDTTLYGASQSLFGKAGKAFDEMILSCQEMGIGVYDAHSEIGPGQFEIATDPSEANKAAFDLMLTREIVYGSEPSAKLAH